MNCNHQYQQGKSSEISKDILHRPSLDVPVYPKYPVLIVDDDPSVSHLFDLKLEQFGITHTEICNDARDVIPLLHQKEFELMILDLRMPYMNGEELFPQIIHDFPSLPIIVLTYLDDLETAVRCIKNGVFDYLPKTVDDSRLFSSVNRAIEFRDMNRELQSLKSHVLSKSLKYPKVFSRLVTQNDTMFSIFQYLESIAQTMYPVFITGETGVGKGLVAEAIHEISQRRGPFVHVNVSGIDDSMFADTLFGHIKGAYTGASIERSGLVERAAEGTLFLDEIGDLSMQSQVKLLTLLQERKYFPIGVDKPKHCHARIITATNCDVENLINTGKFRKDLYFRLHTHRIHLPPLRERLDDLPVLLEYFFDVAALEMNKKKPTVHKELIQLLNTYSFPGNIREVKAMIFDALSRHESRVLSMNTFKSHMNRQKKNNHTQSEKKLTVLNVFKTLKELPTIKDSSEQLIHEALKRANGNLSIAAPILGITRQALSKRLKRQSLENESM
ncbi:MAG: sigma-54-dependent Fis family transcriptional regulator [Candidatus Magnetomorum sp.]|nr:sigma-54-dependent Fis family transcriptional regulator [Candidatus Magnetomorum sp.]